MKIITFLTILLTSWVQAGNPAQDSNPSEVPTFKGKILSVNYEPDILSVELQYSGGCKDHRFEIKWEDEFCETVNYLDLFDFYMCQVQLIHSQGFDDMCDAVITQTHQIPLNITDAPQELTNNPVNSLDEAYYLYLNSDDTGRLHFWVF